MLSKRYESTKWALKRSKRQPYGKHILIPLPLPGSPGTKVISRPLKKQRWSVDWLSSMFAE